MRIVNDLDLDRYSDAYVKTFDERMNAKLNRQWTTSEYVKQLFALIEEKLEASDELFDRNSKLPHAKTFTRYCAVGYVNPKASRCATPTGYKAYGCTKTAWSSRKRDGWDMRYFTACGNKLAMTRELSEEYKESRWRIEEVDIPACYTDYGEHIFVIEDAAMLDVLEAIGKFKMPKAKKGEVFLALSPRFVEENEDIAQIIESAKEDGKVFDIRDWQNDEGWAIEISPDGYESDAWLGTMPDEFAEPMLAGRVIDIISALRGNVIQGYRISELYSMELEDCVNVANALVMDKDFLSFSALEHGKIPTSRGKWAKLGRHFDFSKSKLSENMQKIASKLDELAAIVHFWQLARDEYRISVLFDSNELSKADFVFDKFYAIGQLIGLDDYIETYRSGVPIEDILA